jgi:uroporphyrinogen-III synthase
MEQVRAGVTAARKGAALVAALERRGATVLWGPTLGGDRVRDGADELGHLLAAEPQWLAVSTATALRAVADAATGAGRAEDLAALLGRSRIVARGIKAHGAVRALGHEPVFVSPQETEQDTAAWLARHVLPGDVVAVLSSGAEDPRPYRPVEAAGATVVPVAPYASAPPDDPGPARDLVEAVTGGGLDVLACTSPGAFRNLLTIAEHDGRLAPLLAALVDQVAVAAVGPVTARAVEEAGVPVRVMPLRARTADLVRAIEAWASRGSPIGPAPLRLEGSSSEVRTPTGPIELGPREHALLAALVRRPDVVCPPEQLAVEVWGHEQPGDPRTVKHLVSRVRRKLGVHGGAVETIRSVGYRYSPSLCAPRSHATKVARDAIVT